MVVSAPPDPGQLVEVRRRQFVVQEVQESQLQVSIVKETPTVRQSLVTLSSIDEDSLGESLEVIWELEPGARVVPSAAELPTPQKFDDPDRLGAFLDAVRWGTVSSSDNGILQAPFRSGIAIEDYQLEPLARALQMPRANLLIADDVGLGKTIEAGLIAQEFILRHRVRNILIVCPATLKTQWQEEMREKFGLDFTIVDTEFMRQLRRRRGLHVNPWTHAPRLITSIDWLKQDEPMRWFRDVLPGPGEPIYPRRFDLLILDEAHNVAPSGIGNYSTDSQRTRAVAELVPHFEHRLFLTATPHNGYTESFSALLELLDNQRFARTIEPSEKARQNAVVRRLKSEIENADGTKRFPERRIVALQVDWSEEERESYRWLMEYKTSREANAEGQAKRTATEFTLKLLKKRMFSSPAAFLATLEKHEETLKGRKDRPGKSNRFARALARELETTRDDYDNDEEYEQELDEAVTSATRVFDELNQDERNLIAKLKKWGNKKIGGPDSKAKRLLDWLEKNIRPNGEWSDLRVIIFTEYRATQKWLQGLLAAEGFAADDRLAILYGGMQEDKRKEINAAFQTDPKESAVRILLATDCASEGVNLQNHCSRVIHYEIPWNPNRLEQRNGRVDRHGQKQKVVETFHFASTDDENKSEDISTRKSSELDGDLEFLMIAARKLDRMATDLKGKVNPVIEEQIEERMLGRRRALDTKKAEAEGESIRSQLVFERKLRDDLAKIAEQLRKSRVELHVHPENVKKVVDVGLELAEQQQLKPAKLKGVWPDPAGKRKTCPVFEMPPLRGSWARAAYGLEHPHTRKVRPITFDHEVAQGRDDVVLVHLEHRLVKLCQRLLRAEVWSTAERRKLSRVTAMIVQDGDVDVLEGGRSLGIIAHGRVIVLGKSNQSLHEEIIAAGGVIRDGRYRRLNVGETESLANVTGVRRAPEDIERAIRKLWQSVSSNMETALDARMRERTKTLENRLTEIATREADDIEAILRELEKSIRAQIEKPPPPQLELWPDPQKLQFERDREALVQRVANVPEEIERERKRILGQYSVPVPRLFPIAVTFVVPESWRP